MGRAARAEVIGEDMRETAASAGARTVAEAIAATLFPSKDSAHPGEAQGAEFVAEIEARTRGG